MESGKLPHVPEEMHFEDNLFPLTFHPRLAIAKEMLHAWAEKSLNPHDIEALHKLRIDQLAFSMWPMTLVEPPNRLLTLGQFMFWLFLFDDEVDGCTGEDGGVLQVESLCKRVLDALFGDDKATPSSLEGKEPACVTVAREWWVELKKRMPHSQQARFQVSLTAYVKAHPDERRIIVGSKMQPASVEEYMKLRYDTYALAAFYLLTEYSLGIDLDEEALQSSLLRQLHQAAGEYMYCINDIVSFPREFKKDQDAVLNIVNQLHTHTCKKQKGHVPIHVVVSQTWQMIQERNLDCARLAQEITASPLLASKQDLQSYVKSLCLATTGNWAWHVMAERYKVEDAPTPSD